MFHYFKILLFSSLFPPVQSFICTSVSPFIFLFPIFNHLWEKVSVVTDSCDMQIAFTLFYSCTGYLLIYNFIPRQIDAYCSLSSAKRLAIA